MQFVIDCEFNEFGGELISLALVAQDGREFYEVFEDFSDYPYDRSPDRKVPGSFVRAHVLPVLNKAADSKREIQASLQSFLAQYAEIHVIADWPEDIKHFCDVLLTGPGQRMSLPGQRLFCEIRFDLPSTASLSNIPHNALEDARALARHLGWIR